MSGTLTSSWQSRLFLFMTLAWILPACGGGGGGGAPGPADPGTLRINLDPVPLDDVRALDLHVVRIDVVMSDTPDGAEELLTISDTAQSMGLVGLAGTTPKIFSTILVPREGFIKQIRFVIDGATATRGFVTEPVTIPSGSTSGFKVISADQIVEIKDKFTTDITVALDPEKTVVTDHPDGLRIKPVVKVIVGAVTRAPVNTFVPDRMTVLFKAGTADADIAIILANLGATVEFKNPYHPYYVLNLPLDSDELAVRQSLEAMPEVQAACPEYLGFALGQAAPLFPNDPLLGNQWALHNVGGAPWNGTPDKDIDAPEAWDITTGSSAVIIAVIDSGIDTSHPDFAGNIWVNTVEQAGTPGVDDDGNGFIDDINGWNFGDNNNDIGPWDAHGTQVAGVLGARGNNGVGISGVCWNVRIMPLRLRSSGGLATTAAFFNAVSYARQNGAVIANVSYQWIVDGSLTLSLNSQFDAVVGGLLVVAGAGNDNVNVDADFQMYFPVECVHPQVIGVGATDKLGNIAYFSNGGTQAIEVGAPGREIQTLGLSGTYPVVEGTSFSTPIVSGVAGLIKTQYPALNAIEIRDRIFNNVDFAQNLVAFFRKKGTVNAHKALQ